jgi:hypothetical protein
MWRYPYPNVAAEPAMYCPSVRIIPLGPGPNRMMLVAPVFHQLRLIVAFDPEGAHTEDEANDQTDSCCSTYEYESLASSREEALHPPIIAPIWTVKLVSNRRSPEEAVGGTYASQSETGRLRHGVLQLREAF